MTSPIDLEFGTEDLNYAAYLLVYKVPLKMLRKKDAHMTEFIFSPEGNTDLDTLRATFLNGEVNIQDFISAQDRLWKWIKDFKRDQGTQTQQQPRAGGAS